MEKKHIIIAIAVLIAVFLGGYLFGARLTGDNGRIDDLETKLGTLERKINDTRKLVDQTAEGLAGTRNDINAVRNGLGTISAGLGENRNTIRDVRGELKSSLGIIGEIRAINSRNQEIYNAVEERN